jgi:hypothetical protein
VCVAGSRIRLTVTDVVDEQQAKLRPQTVDNKTPQLLVTAEATRKHNERPVFRTNNLDVVPGVNVHGSSFRPLLHPHDERWIRSASFCAA